MHQPAIGNLLFGALAKDALQIRDWIGRIGERIGPLLLEMRMNDLPHNRVSQIFFALEVMKHCAFGRTRFINDAIETTALKSVFVKFIKGRVEDFRSGVFWRSGRGCLHSSFTIQTSRYVSSSNFISSRFRKTPLTVKYAKHSCRPCIEIHGLRTPDRAPRTSQIVSVSVISTSPANFRPSIDRFAASLSPEPHASVTSTGI